MLGAVPCSRKSGKLNLLISLISSWVFRGVSKNLEISWRGVNNLGFLPRTLSYIFLKRKASNVAWMAFKFGAGKATHSHLSPETSKAQQIHANSMIINYSETFSCFFQHSKCFAEYRQTLTGSVATSKTAMSGGQVPRIPRWDDGYEMLLISSNHSLIAFMV